jgi:hypothetical protein
LDIPSPLAVERDDRYDWLMVVCAAWLLVGLFADGWSHYHDVRESFFTPYHAVLYAGFFANVLAVGVPLLANLRRGLRWPNALAPGYDLTAIGVAIFTIGVIPDFTWHHVFGIEEGIDVLISPTHLFMGIGMALILLGPARAAFARPSPPTRLEDQAPMLVSLGLFLAMIEFTLQFAFDPGVSSSNAPLAPDANGSTTNLAFFLLPFTYYKEALGITIVIIHTALLAGFALFAVRNAKLAPGALTLLFTLPALLMAVLLSSGALSVYVPVVVALAGGAFADLLVARLQPGPARPRDFRLFAIAVPAFVQALYLALAALLLGGVWWDVNFTFGSVLFAGVVGVLLSYLMLSPGHLRQQP